MQHNKTTLCLLFLFLLATVDATGQGASLRHIVRHNPWEESANPAGIYYTAADSLLEASAGYRLAHRPLALSDEPDKTQTYGAGVYGYKRFSRLQLRGGMSWQQNRTEGDKWNLLVQPDYLVAAGDSAPDTRRRLEQYCIHGTTAYALSSRLTAGLGATYTTTDNLDRAPEFGYTGRAHTTHLSAGLIREGRQWRTGFSVAYTHTSELLSYPTQNSGRLFVYPMGFYIPMSEITDPGEQLRSGSATSNSTVFRSIGNRWQAALQAEWHPAAGWSWLNELSASYLHRNSNPNTTDNMLGWTEQFATLHYTGRLTRSRGRWTHLVSPRLTLQTGLADRILQRVPADDLSAAKLTFATYRQAARWQAAAHLGYELARDYTSAGPTLAWQASADWYSQREEAYAHPFTYAQQTHTFRGEVAFLRSFTLRHTDGLTLRPALSFTTGYGTEEEVTRQPISADALNKHRRSYGRVAQDYASRTATRLGFGLQAEYRHPLSHSLTAGLRLHAAMEQVTGAERETGGQVVIGLFVCL